MQNTTKAALLLLAVAAFACSLAYEQYDYVRVMEQDAIVVDATVVRYDDCSPMCGKSAENHYVVKVGQDNIPVYDWAWAPRKPGQVVQVLNVPGTWYIQDADLTLGEDGRFYARWAGGIALLALGVYLSPHSSTAMRFRAACGRFVS